MTAHTTPGGVLILSDGKPGHENQSLAVARHLDWPYQLIRVRFKSAVSRLLSYPMDHLGLNSAALFQLQPEPRAPFSHILACGATTYYPAKVLAARSGAAAIGLMRPRGYRWNFQHILMPEHDRNRGERLPSQVVILPINACFVESRGVFRPPAGPAWQGLMVGGNGRAHRLDPKQLQRQLQALFELTPHQPWVVATSRRTPATVEAVLRQFPFEKSFFYSQDPQNPLPDMLKHCARVVLTADSTSMISEAVSVGAAWIEILAVQENRRAAKHRRLLHSLEKQGCLHRFEGTFGEARQKIDLGPLLRRNLTKGTT